jgi:hypothetical protein
MSARRLVPIVALTAILACWPMCDSSSASVSFNANGEQAFELVSTSSALQAEYAYEPAVSASGEYVAFTGVVASKPGVYRKDRATHELEIVALGVGVGAPSISANGEYVSFTSFDDPATGAPAINPVTQTPEGCAQVYRRQMSVAPTAPGAYRVASALSGPADEPLNYSGSGTSGCPGEGSASANRVAISGDGSKVVFTVIGESNLARPATPAEQVAVRDFSTETTILVSVTRESLENPAEQPQPVPGGATLSEQGFERPSSEKPKRQEPSRDNSTAAISAGGSTVAWMGVNISEQASTGSLGKPGYPDEYAEPLWRRMIPEEPTRRVLAGEDPSCPPTCSGGLNLEWNNELPPPESAKPYQGPQHGSYVEPAPGRRFTGVQAVTPQLSEDGMQVAILSTQPDEGHEPVKLPGEEQDPTPNAFVVNMTPGLTREQAITRLTEWGSHEFGDASFDGSIDGIAISGDGSRVAFTTERDVFPFAPQAIIKPQITQVGAHQLYDVNLQAGTMALVSEGYNGEPANLEEKAGGITAVALSGDGKELALASGSSNLVGGAVNEGSDVFFTQENDSPEEIGQQSVTPLPPGLSDEPEWDISATATPSSGGALVIDVSIPGAGRLAVSASGSVPVTVPVVKPSRKASRPRAKRSSHGSNASASAAKARTVTVVETRELAHAASASQSAALMQLRLVASSGYRPLEYEKGGLYATVTVTFAAPGHRTLKETLQASFPRLYAKRKAKPAAHKPRPKPHTKSGRA